jgi:hypothetical protein
MIWNQNWSENDFSTQVYLQCGEVREDLQNRLYAMNDLSKASVLDLTFPAGP